MQDERQAAADPPARFVTPWFECGATGSPAKLVRIVAHLPDGAEQVLWAVESGEPPPLWWTPHTGPCESHTDTDCTVSVSFETA